MNQGGSTQTSGFVFLSFRVLEPPARVCVLSPGPPSQGLPSLLRATPDAPCYGLWPSLAVCLLPAFLTSYPILHPCQRPQPPACLPGRPGLCGSPEPRLLLPEGPGAWKWGLCPALQPVWGTGPQALRARTRAEGWKEGMSGGSRQTASPGRAPEELCPPGSPLGGDLGQRLRGAGLPAAGRRGRGEGRVAPSPKPSGAFLSLGGRGVPAQS